MVSFKQFFSESGFKSFIFLPKEQPYGFVVWPDGTFKPVKRMYGHADVAGGEKELDTILRSGGVRMSQPIGDAYFGEVNQRALKPQAKKTAMDIANFYNADIDFVQYYVNESTGSYQVKSSFSELPDSPPHGFWWWCGLHHSIQREVRPK